MSTPCIATVGTFDGVHNGHRDLIERMVAEGRRRGLPVRVITFAEHPLSVLAPERAPGLLCPRQRVGDMLALPGVDSVSMLHFTPELAALTAAEFMAMIRERFGVQVLMMGYDNSFGSDRPAAPEAYQTIGLQAGVEVLAAPPYVTPGGRTPGSSAMRRALAAGDMEAYADMGGEWAYTAVSRPGRQLGRQLGFPTVNLCFDPALQAPRRGVYFGSVTAGADTYPAVVNVGTCPTVTDGSETSLEAHILTPDPPVGYGDTVTVALRRHLRDERRFCSVDELRRAIAADVERAMQLVHPENVIK